MKPKSNIFTFLLTIGLALGLQSFCFSQTNDSVFGLQAGVFTNNFEHVKIAHQELEVGGVMINNIPGFRIDSMPYGGVKDSGLGREGIKYTMEEMTEEKLIIFWKNFKNVQNLP